MKDVASERKNETINTIAAFDWWAVVKWEEDVYEEVPIMAFAWNKVSEFDHSDGKIHTFMEMAPIMQNFSGDVSGFYGDIYNEDLKDHGKIIIMYRGKGNHGIKDVEISQATDYRIEL